LYSYNPSTKTMTQLAPIWTGMGNPYGLVVYQGTLYALGGRGIQSYNISANIWSIVHTYVVGVSYDLNERACTIFQDRILMFGAREVNNARPWVHSYNLTTNTITELQSLSANIC